MILMGDTNKAYSWMSSTESTFAIIAVSVILTFVVIVGVSTLIVQLTKSKTDLKSEHTDKPGENNEQH